MRYRVCVWVYVVDLDMNIENSDLPSLCYLEHVNIEVKRSFGYGRKY
jgi:hypothetical protein